MRKASKTRKQILIVLAIVCLVLFTLMLIKHDQLRGIDLAFNQLLNGYGTFFFALFSLISFFGSIYWIPWVFLFILYHLWKRKKRYEAVFLALAVGSNYVVVNAVKILTNWARPSEVQHAVAGTFPSAHASTPFVLYVLAYLFLVKLPRKSHIIGLIIFSMLIGLSRIIVNAHWITDVVAGFLLAVAWISGAVAYRAHKKI